MPEKIMALAYRSTAYYGATFLAGFALMVVEMTASRVVAPLIGASLFTWTGVIGVTLLGLSVGSFLGGTLADQYVKRFGDKVLAYAFLGAAVSVYLIIPLSQHLNFILDRVSSIISATMLVSGALFLVPALFLGALAPIIFKVYVASLDHLGEKYGQLSGTWSLGSIVGVFTTGFYFISSVGSARTLGIVAAILLFGFYGFYLTSLSRSGREHEVRFVITLTFVLGLLVVFVHQTSNRPAAAVIFEQETPYYLARVLDYTLYPEYGKNRILLLDIDPHSIQTELESHRFYTDIYPAFSAFLDSVSRIHVVGAGAYTLPIKLKKQYSSAEVSVSEIDPALEGIARSYFNLGSYDVSTEIGDARIKFARASHAPEERYDLIYGDAYNSFISVPWHLLTKEYLRDVTKHLTPGGVYAINFIGVREGPQSQLFNSIYRTFNEVFPNNYLFAFATDATSVQNITIIGVHSSEVVSDTVVRRRLDAVDRTKFLSSHYVAREAALERAQAGVVLTDDLAPVEVMMAGILQQYFAPYFAQYRTVLGRS